VEDQTAKQQLIHYLLGGLPVEERRQIEERYFDDKDFFQEMLIIEDELIDSYVNRELSYEEAEQFEKHYLTAPERCGQVEFAKLLATSLSSLNRPRSLEASPAPPPVRASLFSAWRARYRPWRWQFITALAVVALLLLGMISLWLRNQASQLAQERALLFLQRQETDRLNQRLERDLKRLEQERKYVESLPVSSSGDAKIAIGMLFPMLARSGQAGQVLHISPLATLLLLQAPVDSASDKTYQAALTRDGTEILRLTHVIPRLVSSGNIVEIPMTAAMLNGRSYALTVKPEDDEEGTDSYSFEIQKP